MKEMNARLSIMAVEELTAAQKLILLYILTRVDWTTWSGSVSTNDIEVGTAQSGRNIKRSLKALSELGYIERHITKRDSGLHHKAMIKVNTSKLEAQDSPSGVTESHHTDNVIGDRKSPPVVTESHHTNSVTSDRKSPPVVTDCPPNGDRKSLGVVTSCPSSGDRKSPNINIDQYNINIDQSKINLPEEEVEMNPPREDYLQPGWVWCERCHQHVPKDEPHLYPMSELPCVEDAHDPEQAKVKEWDLAWGKHEPKVKPPVERQEGFIYFIDEITSELDYKREVLRVVDHHERKDVRLCLWNRSEGDALFQKMMRELIAPRSAIDWVTIQMGGQVERATPPPPPEPSKVWTVTVDQQLKIREADQAWMNGSTNNGGSDSW